MTSTATAGVRRCLTCQYWQGRSVRVKCRGALEYDPLEKAKCNLNGHERPQGAVCKDYVRRLGL